MGRISVQPEILSFAAIRADGLEREFTAAASTIKSTPLAGLEPSTRGRTMAAVAYASALTRSGGGSAASLGREYRRRVELARRADASSGVDKPRPGFWSRFWDSATHPDQYTKAGWGAAAFAIPNAVLREYLDRGYHLREARKLVGKENWKARGLKLGNLAVRGAFGGLAGLPRPKIKMPKIEIKKHLTWKTTGRIAKHALPKGVPILGEVLTYRSARAQGRSRLDSLAKTAVTSAGSKFGAGVAVAGGVALAPETMGSSLLATPLLAFVGGVAGGVGTSALYDAARPAPGKPAPRPKGPVQKTVTPPKRPTYGPPAPPKLVEIPKLGAAGAR